MTSPEKKEAVPFEAEPSNMSSELNERVRISVLCPGKSREQSFVGSGGFSLERVGGGMLWTSRAFEASARKI